MTIGCSLKAATEDVYQDNRLFADGSHRGRAL